MRPSKVLQILISAATVLGVQSALANATYYTREDSVRCQNQTRNATIGAAAGGGLGLGGALAAGANTVGTLVTTGIGMVAGGVLGLGLSCEEEVRYVEHVDETIGDYRNSINWERPIERGNYRIIMLERGKNRFGDSCSFYQVEFYGADGRPYAVRETACRIGGMWRHFRYYEGDQPVIFHRHYVNRHAREQMRVVWAPPRNPYPLVRANVDIGPAGPPPMDYRYERMRERDLDREARSLDYRYGQMRAGQQSMQ